MLARNEDVATLRWPSKFNEVPKEVFNREDVYRLELERIFYGPEWHMLAHRSEIAKAGDFKTATIGQAPVLIVHGDDGEIRVFANSCTHRATQLKTCARGSGKEIECPYHRWLYNNQGDLIGAPGMREFQQSFRREDYALRKLRTAEFCGIIFATFSEDAPAFDDYLGETKPFIAKAVGGDGRLKLLGYQKVSFASNWKAYADNEGYHGPLLHTAFQMLKWSTSNGAQFMTDHAHKVNHIELGQLPDFGPLQDSSVIEGRDPKLVPVNLIVSLFPLSLIIHNLDVINLRYAFPISPHETEVHYAYFAHEDDDEALVRHRIRQGSNLQGPSGFISLEDGAVFNRIHVGSHTAGNAEFQKGVTGPEAIATPFNLGKGDEAGNLIRWEHYRKAMGFERG
jgi:anthranilate 1,2-dioxygenase large subunit